MNKTWPRTAPLDCHGQGGDGEFGTHMLAHRPTDDFSGEQIEDHGQVEPALAGRDIGDIRQPDLIRLLGHEIPIEQVGRDRQRMLAVGRAHAIAARYVSPDAMPAHDPLDPLATDTLALGTQFGVDTRRPHIGPGARHEPAGYRAAVRDWRSRARAFWP